MRGHQKHSQRRAIAQLRVSNDFCDHNDRSEEEQHERECAMETLKFGLEPGIPSPLQEAPFFRVRVIEFERTGVAGSLGRTVKHGASLMVGLKMD